MRRCCFMHRPARFIVAAEAFRLHCRLHARRVRHGIAGYPVYFHLSSLRVALPLAPARGLLIFFFLLHTGWRCLSSSGTVWPVPWPCASACAVCFAAILWPSNQYDSTCRHFEWLASLSCSSSCSCIWLSHCALDGYPVIIRSAISLLMLCGLLGNRAKIIRAEGAIALWVPSRRPLFVCLVSAKACVTATARLALEPKWLRYTS